MAGHAAQQHVLLECPRICQLLNTMKSSIPAHRFHTAIWKFTAGQHFACFHRQLRSLGVSHQYYTLHGLRGGGAVDEWLQYRDLPHLRRRGRWTAARTLDRYVQEETLLLQNPALQGSCRPSPCSRRDRASFLCKEEDEQDKRRPCHQPPQPPRCNGKGRGAGSNLRSGVKQQSFPNSVSPLGTLPLPLSDGQKKQADDAHYSNTDTLGWIMSSPAYGGPDDDIVEPRSLASPAYGYRQFVHVVLPMKSVQLFQFHHYKPHVDYRDKCVLDSVVSVCLSV